MAPLSKCVKPNHEIQIDVGRPIINKKGIEQYFITSVDKYSKYPTAEIVNNASGTNITKFLYIYIYIYIYIITEYLEQLD